MNIGGSTAYTKNYIAFYTKGDGTSDAALTAVFNEDGQFGIGTNNPNRTFVLNHSTQPQASWQVSDAEKLRIQSTGSAGYIDSVNQDLYFRAGTGGTTKRMMITNDGTVLFGNDIPNNPTINFNVGSGSMTSLAVE